MVSVVATGVEQRVIPSVRRRTSAPMQSFSQATIEDHADTPYQDAPSGRYVEPVRIWRDQSEVLERALRFEPAGEAALDSMRCAVPIALSGTAK